MNQECLDTKTIELYHFCRKLPKVELHAHLNGSISRATIEELKNLTSGAACSYTLVPGEFTLANCFDVFKQIHDLVKTQEAVQLSTQRVIEEFASDGVKYLELRTTPKAINGDKPLSKSEYIDAVLKGIELAEVDQSDMKTRLLISIDRSKSVEEAMENVQLASQYSKKNDHLVIGVDFSGNPSAQDARLFINALQFAKNEGLKISAHLSEVSNKNDETMAILETIVPDRIGHGTYLHSFKGGSKEMEDFVTRNKVPLELCLTSNVLSGTATSYKDHHYTIWSQLKHPLIICTDDKGLFNSDLSNEYKILAENFNLSLKDLYNLSYHSIDYIFDNDSKEPLKEIWSNFNKSVKY